MSQYKVNLNVLKKLDERLDEVLYKVTQGSDKNYFVEKSFHWVRSLTLVIPSKDKSRERKRADSVKLRPNERSPADSRLLLKPPPRRQRNYWLRGR